MNENMIGAMLIASGVAEKCRQEKYSLTEAQIEIVRDLMLIVVEQRKTDMAEIAQLKKDIENLSHSNRTLVERAVQRQAALLAQKVRQGL